MLESGPRRHAEIYITISDYANYKERQTRAIGRPRVPLSWDYALHRALPAVT